MIDYSGPPFEVEELRVQLSGFLDTILMDAVLGPMKIGNYRCGVYAFYDYDGEPIYVGQTTEKLRARIGRHLTNQRTDAVAMSVLDPFEVFDIEVWPLPQFQTVGDPQTRPYLDTLESVITEQAVRRSRFGAILNEKNPPAQRCWVEIPPSIRGCIVSDGVKRLRSHPDVRIARRALTISRLAQSISERKVQGGLRRVLATQAKRLAWLSATRFEQLGGARSVEVEEGEP